MPARKTAVKDPVFSVALLGLNLQSEYSARGLRVRYKNLSATISFNTTYFPSCCAITMIHRLSYEGDIIPATVLKRNKKNINACIFRSPVIEEAYALTVIDDGQAKLVDFFSAVCDNHLICQSRSNVGLRKKDKYNVHVFLQPRKQPVVNPRRRG